MQPNAASHVLRNSEPDDEVLKTKEFTTRDEEVQSFDSVDDWWFPPPSSR